MGEARRAFTLEEARRYGEEVGIDWRSSRFDVEQFCMGMNVELEHGLRDILTNISDDDPHVTARIALAHLNEFPDYYTRLERPRIALRGRAVAGSRISFTIEGLPCVAELDGGEWTVSVANATIARSSNLAAAIVEATGHVVSRVEAAVAAARIVAAFTAAAGR